MQNRKEANESGVTRRTMLGAGLAGLVLPAPSLRRAAGPTVEELETLFRNPPKKYSPVPTWWWSGERLEPKRLRYEMERMVEGGLYNVCVIHLAPAAPWVHTFPDSPAFFSEEWWGLFRGVCQNARELGMKVWFYDQIGFSSANIQANLLREKPEFLARWLKCEERVVNGPAELECPSEGEALGAAAIPVEENGRATGKALPVAVEGRLLRWRGTGRHRLRLFYTTRGSLDMLNPTACRALLDHIHGEYERRAGEFFGDVIAGSFQDELPMVATWTDGFEKRFEREKGYRITDHLAALWEGEDQESIGVRADYQRMRGALAEESFFRPLFDWHQRRGFYCGFDQHTRAGEPSESVAYYADYPRAMRWFAAPGSDHGGDSKIHSSLAHLYGRPFVWIESFHSSGWGGTLEDTFEWLVPRMQNGATLYNPHAIYYSTRGGWWEWAPPSTCWRQPYWKHYPVFSTAVRRLACILSQGRHVADVAVLYPSATAQGGSIPGAIAPETGVGAVAHAIYRKVVVQVGQPMEDFLWKPGVLDHANRDFEVLDDASVARGTVGDGELRIGEESYKAVVLPGCAVMEPETAAMLVRFVKAGGLLVAIGPLPQFAAGRQADRGPVEALRALFEAGRAVAIERAEELPAALERVPRRVETDVPTLLRRVGETTVLFLPGMRLERSSFQWTGDRGWHATAKPSPEVRRVRVRGLFSAPEMWDPLTGERRALPATVDGDGVSVEVPLSGQPAALLVWTGKAAGARQKAAASREVARLEGPWQVTYEQTIDNRFGDFTKPDGAPVPVQTWDFEHRVGEAGEWREAHATFGEFGWWTGPAPERELPQPLEALSQGEDRLQVAGWKRVAYSLSRGIYKDSIHRRRYGVRGFVPEDFLNFGGVPAGVAVQFRTTVRLPEAQTAHLMVSAPAAKKLWVDGRLVGESASGDFCVAPVSLSPGRHLIEFRLSGGDGRDLRGWWALARSLERFGRPDWMEAPDASRKDTRLRFSGVWSLPARPGRARIQFATSGATPCNLRVNGRLVSWVNDRARIQPCDVTALVKAGENEVTVEVLDHDQNWKLSVLVDGVAELAGGGTSTLMSGRGWKVSRDGSAVEPVLLGFRRDQPDTTYLWRRQHPLPGAAWLEDQPADGTVLAVTPDAFPERAAVEWLKWTAPPGAVAMRLPVAGKARVMVDGVEVAASGLRVALPRPEAVRRVCTVRVEPEPGRTGGALLDGPVTYEVAGGTMEPGDWCEQGLGNYSGGIRYRRKLLVRSVGDQAVLDLGRVRGTAEVWVNGRVAGVRIWRPYHFDISKLLVEGENDLEVLVLNTLGPYLKGHSATSFTLAGQEVSGLMGPVRLLA